MGNKILRKRLYIKRPRKLKITPIFFNHISNYKDNYYKYHINEFKTRYTPKLLKFTTQHYYDIITSNDIGYSTIPFIAINTQYYVFGGYYFFVFPRYKFVLTPTLFTWTLHDPVNDKFIQVTRPYEIIVKDDYGYYVLSGITAAYFIFGLEKLFLTTINNEQLLNYPCPKNRIKYYSKQLSSTPHFYENQQHLNLLLQNNFLILANK
ncbi:MAG: hypothetical protein RML94_10220 [Bacteroidia bacterium]|nr:hypothetical protein [Bacteroidia bacterium]